MATTRAIPVHIYKNNLFEGCSNHGISERYDEVLVLHPDGFIEVDLENPPENFCFVETKDVGSAVYLYCRPWAEPKGAGWMSGGSLVSSSDSRFRELSDYPLSLHDRDESWEMYNSISSD